MSIGRFVLSSSGRRGKFEVGFDGQVWLKLCFCAAGKDLAQRVSDELQQIARGCKLKLVRWSAARSPSSVPVFYRFFFGWEVPLVK